MGSNRPLSVYKYLWLQSAVGHTFDKQATTFLGREADSLGKVSAFFIIVHLHIAPVSFKLTAHVQ